jgi:hypothetical protein
MITSSRVKIDFEFIDPCLCNAWVATAVIGSAVIGAGATAWGASKAADAQKDAADKAGSIAQAQYQQTREDLSPYRDIGAQASGDLSKRLSELTSPISVDPNELENSDYYKFASTQGQKAVTNAAAARGLGSSAAALKGAAAYAKGLATDTYKTAWDMENTNKTNAYNRLKSLVDTGVSAAGQTGTAGTAAATTSANAAIGAGNAQASAANATGGAISNMASNIGGYAMYKGLYGGGSAPTTTMIGNYKMPTYG